VLIPPVHNLALQPSLGLRPLSVGNDARNGDVQVENILGRAEEEVMALGEVITPTLSMRRTQITIMVLISAMILVGKVKKMMISRLKVKIAMVIMMKLPVTVTSRYLATVQRMVVFAGLIIKEHLVLSLCGSKIGSCLLWNYLSHQRTCWFLVS
jgi:hypothetical protein